MDQPEPIASAAIQRARTLTLAFAMLLASLGTSIANIALPALAETFVAPFAQVQAVVVAYLAALTVSVVLAGRLGDRCGAKPMLVAGLALFMVASLACALAPGLWLLIAARALQGMGAACLMTLAMALMRQTAGPARIGRAMGLLGTMSALGTALGPSLGGLVIPVAGWRGIFWVQIPLAALALLLAVVTLPRAAASAGTPPVPLRAVMSRALVPSLIVNILVGAVMMATLVVGPFFLSRALGLEAGAVGWIMAVGPAISIFSGVPAGRLVDRWGSERVILAGLALLTAGAVLLALVPPVIGPIGYVLSMAVLTPGYQLFQAANNSAVLMDVAADRRGTVSGLLSLSRNIGLIAGAAGMGLVFALGVGAADISQAGPAAITAGMRLTFLLAAVLMLLAAVAMLRPRLAARGP